MNIEEAKIWIAKQEFVNAKSYEKTYPHCYTTRSRCDENEFMAFLWLIRYNGKLKTFYSKQYIYLELDDYEYWEMGRPIPAVQVLNRAIINDNAKYRKPFPTKEEETILKTTLLQREIELECLLNKTNKTEEDNRKIKFLMNSERRINGGGKNIIDHFKIKTKYE